LEGQKLSKRELEVMEMVATGASNQEIAGRLHISVNTVKVHLRNIFEKLGTQSRTEATMRVIQEGWVALELPFAPPPPPPPALPPTPEEVESPSVPVYDVLPAPPWRPYYLLAATLLALVVGIVPLFPPKAATLPALPIRLPGGRPYPIATATPPPDASHSNNSWTPQAAMPAKKAGMGLVAYRERLFAIGGMGANNQVTRRVEIYDPLQNSWSEGANKPTAVADVGAVLFDDKIYLPGGCGDDGQPTALLEIYSPQTDSWETGPPLPAPRCGYGLALLGGKMYLLGGWNGEQFESTIFRFSFVDNSWEELATSMPQAAGYMGAAVITETIYLVGGHDGADELDQTYQFNPTAGTWLARAPLPEKRAGLGLVNIADNLYAIGGGWQQPLTPSERYDPATNTWTPFEAPFTHQWVNPGLAAIGTKIYAVGGLDTAQQEYLDAVVSYQVIFHIFLPFSTAN
jgi:DNA-binding CsgD family transcriptional regulator